MNGSLHNTTELRIAGLDCEDEGRVIADALSEVPGLCNIQVNPHAAKVSFTHDETSPSIEGIHSLLARLGLPVSHTATYPPRHQYGGIYKSFWLRVPAYCWVVPISSSQR